MLHGLLIVGHLKGLMHSKLVLLNGVEHRFSSGFSGRNACFRRRQGTADMHSKGIKAPTTHREDASNRLTHRRSLH